MHVLTAHNPRGHLHAVTCITPDSAYTAERFTHTQQAQGCTVVAHTLAEYLAQVRHSQTAEKPALAQAIRTPEPECAVSLDKNHEKTATESDVLAQENRATGLVLPSLGENLVHPVIGYATVTHFLTLDGRQVAVAAGPRGAGLVRAGEWRPATDADKPFGTSRINDTPERFAALPVPQNPSPDKAMPAAPMVSLFDLDGGA